MSYVVYDPGINEDSPVHVYGPFDDEDEALEKANALYPEDGDGPARVLLLEAL